MNFKQTFFTGLILLISFYSFGQDPYSHRLKSLRTTSLETAKTYCSGESIPSGSRHKIVILGKKLEVGKIYFIKPFRNYDPKYYYVLSATPGDNFFDDEDEVIDASAVLSGPIFCDQDDDGVEDGIDNCPNQPGPASNNGCPVATDYDLSLSAGDIFTYSNCFDCSNPLSVLGSKKHILYTGNSIQVQFTVKNKGEAVSEPVKIRFYMSKNKDSKFGVQATSKAISLPSIAPGGSYLTNPSFSYSSDFPVDLGSYYLVIDVEPGSKDKNTSNNYKSIPVKVETFGRSSLLFSNEIKSIHVFEQPYTVSIYNASGFLIAQKTLATKEEEESFVQSVPKGFYIVKNGTDTYKIVRE